MEDVFLVFHESAHENSNWMVFPENVSVLGTEDATTCHIAVIRHSGEFFSHLSSIRHLPLCLSPVIMRSHILLLQLYIKAATTVLCPSSSQPLSLPYYYLSLAFFFAFFLYIIIPFSHPSSFLDEEIIGSVKY